MSNLKYLRTKKMRMNHALTNKGLDRAYIRDGDDAAQIAQEDLDEVNVDSVTGKAKSYTRDMGRASVVAAIQAIAEGKMIIVVDDESRENEGDFIMAAEGDPEQIGFMIRHSSGVLCASVESARLDSLNLPPMVTNNQDPKGTAYSVSVDAKKGTSTGISASDRALTFRTLADPLPLLMTSTGLVTCSLCATLSGTLIRAGHTEATVDLCRAAGCQPVGMLCSCPRRWQHAEAARPEDLRCGARPGARSIQDLVAYRLETETKAEARDRE